MWAFNDLSCQWLAVTPNNALERTLAGLLHCPCSRVADLSLVATAVGRRRLKFGPFVAFRKPVARPRPKESDN